jgi:tetratricopeptide (TPR) repeat protein
MRLISAAILILCSLSGCNRDPDGSGHRDEDAGYVGPFGNDSDRISSVTVDESKQIDSIQKSMDNGLFEKARQQIATLLAAGCTHPTVLFMQAKLLYQQSDFAGALPWCDRAISASPYWIEPRITLAQCYFRLERLAAAETVFADLDRLAPRLPWGPYGIGVVALMRGDRPRAIKLLDEALKRDPEHAPSLKVRAELAEGVDPVLEEDLLIRLLAQEPDSAWAYGQLGSVALAGQRLDDAHRALLRSYALQPDIAIARLLVQIAKTREDPQETALWEERAGVPPPQKENAHP